MGISMNGPSGIDTAYIIDSLVGLEKEKTKKVQDKIDDYDVKIEAYSKLRGLVKDIETQAKKLDTENEFTSYTTSSSNEDVATFTADTGAVEGSYSLKVFQLAESEKMVSKDGLITEQGDALSNFGINTGTINVDGVDIDIESTDTIQDVRMKINNATDSQGNRLNVTASVLKVADNNYRLLLSSRSEGDEGVEYKDVTGSTLQDLGIITDASGSKGNTQQVIETSEDFSTAFSSLAVGESIVYSGTDRNGNIVQNMFIKGADSTEDDFIKQVSQTFHGMADVSIDGDGHLLLKDKTAGTSQLSMSSFKVNGTNETFSITTAGKNGDGVLTTGKNSFFSINDLTMQSDDNDADGFITGVTIHLKQTSVNEAVKLDTKVDLDAIANKTEELFNSFNALVRYSREATSYGSSDDKDSSVGVLAGDMTVRSIVSQVRSVFSTKFDLLDGDYNSVAEIGIKTDVHTGEITLDKDKFTQALKDDYNGVVGMFTTRGFSDNKNISYGRHTRDTTRGLYSLEEVDSEHFRIKKDGDSTWYTSDARFGDVITFSDGPAKGLSITAPAGSAGGNTVSFTFSKGLAELLSDVSNNLTDSEGVISLRQDSWRSSIKSSQDRITRMEASTEAYRLRLVKQFSNMEKSLNDMKSQSSSMMAALGQ